MLLNNIFFEFNSATLTEESKTELFQVVELLKQNEGLNITISGHTDDQGTQAYNMNLSKDRAKAVYDFLVENGVLTDAPPVEDYITDKYLKLVAENETLTEFTLKSSSGYINPDEASVGENNQQDGAADNASSSGSGHLSYLRCVAVASLLGGFLAN